MRVGENVHLIPHFHDRGDPAAWDFDLTDLTTDNTWRDLDLSSIVPAGAKLVLLRVYLLDNLVSQYFQLRENGNSNTYNMDGQYTQVADKPLWLSYKVACDTNRVIEYRATNTTWANISILVAGWWK